MEMVPTFTLNISLILLHHLMLEVKKIILGGQGEPFMYSRLFDALEYAKSSGFDVSLISSGFFLNEKNIKTIFDLKIDCLDISLQAATAETYSRIHPSLPKDTFQRIKDQLLLLSQLKKKFNQAAPRVALIHVMCSLNYKDTPKVIEFADAVGAKTVGFKRIDVVPATKSLLLNKEQLDELKGLLNEAERKAKELGVNTGIRTYRKYILAGLTTGTYTTDFYSQIPCYVGWRSARILEDGDVIPCCGCYSLIMGNIHKSSFIDVWYSEEYKKFRQQAKGLDKKGLIQSGCKCFSCVDYGLNLGVYRRLHPFKSNKLNI